MLILMKGKRGVLSEKQLMLQARKQLPSPPQACKAGELFFVYYLFSILLHKLARLDNYFFSSILFFSFHIHHSFFLEKQLLFLWMLQARKQLPSPPQACKAGELLFLFFFYLILLLSYSSFFFFRRNNYCFLWMLQVRFSNFLPHTQAWKAE